MYRISMTGMVSSISTLTGAVLADGASCDAVDVNIATPVDGTCGIMSGSVLYGENMLS